VVAARTLTRTAPERLQAMRSGSSTTPRETATQQRLTRRQQGAMACVVAALIALFPQAMVPAILTARGEDEVRVWFLAMYAPTGWRWTVISARIVLALGLLLSARRLHDGVDHRPAR